MPTSTALPNSKTLRVVDLFCGGGGLSLGFHGIQAVDFDVVMGIDNDSSAIKVFNLNSPVPSESRLPIGRRADLTWFHHPAEIRLFYLVHLAETTQDKALLKILKQIDLQSFLAGLRQRDETFSTEASELAASSEYSSEFCKVADATFSLAICRTFLGRLALPSLSKPEASTSDLPWCEEYAAFASREGSPSTGSPNAEIKSSLAELWNSSIEYLRQSSKKTGTGQNVNNSGRVETLVAFLESTSGRQLMNLWLAWRAGRDTDRAKFCLKHSELLQNAYKDRRAHLLLGGPPCKGFSRIGRPVIESLRDQGVHAWSHHEFGDERNALMLRYVLFLESLKPDAFVFENVSNFQSVLKTPSGTLDAPEVLRNLIADLSDGDVSYHVDCRVVNAKDYGVPQDRRRFIMVGINARKAKPPSANEFFSSHLKARPVPLGVALWALPPPLEFFPGGNVRVSDQVECLDLSSKRMSLEVATYWNWIRQPLPNGVQSPRHTDAHVYRRMREDDGAFLKYVAPNIRWMDLKISNTETLDAMREFVGKVVASKDHSLADEARKWQGELNDGFWLKILLEHISRKNGLSENHLLRGSYLSNGAGTHGDWFERLSATKPCKTIVAHIGKDTYGYFHPFENRAITIREAARVQSFPDFFQFGSAGVVDAYSIIGNAVPPLLANHFARSFVQLHEKYSIFDDAERFSGETISLPTQQALVL